jgi:hypothetical protein
MISAAIALARLRMSALMAYLWYLENLRTVFSRGTVNSTAFLQIGRFS